MLISNSKINNLETEKATIRAMRHYILYVNKTDRTELHCIKPLHFICEKNFYYLDYMKSPFGESYDNFYRYYKEYEDSIVGTSNNLSNAVYDYEMNLLYPTIFFGSRMPRGNSVYLRMNPSYNLISNIFCRSRGDIVRFRI